MKKTKNRREYFKNTEKIQNNMIAKHNNLAVNSLTVTILLEAPLLLTTKCRIYYATAYVVSVLKRCGVRLSVRPSVCPMGRARGSSEAVQRRTMCMVGCI